ncbi:Recombination protein N [Dorea longicatena]|jgi:DNA repair protein RecN (Recombination protein N)|nr:Recombination protein N [Dorea longicatena]
MRFIGKSRQVLCITHLAQIASKADAHYLIQKQAKENVTKTEIIPLSKENSIHELARLLGGDKMTASILESAKEMKELAMSEI